MARQQRAMQLLLMDRPAGCSASALFHDGAKILLGFYIFKLHS